MITKTITIEDSSSKGKNSVPPLVRLACQFQSNIVLCNEDRRINAKSMLGVMALALSSGMEVDLLVEGPDEAEAAEALEDFFRGPAN